MADHGSHPWMLARALDRQIENPQAMPSQEWTSELFPPLNYQFPGQTDYQIQQPAVRHPYLNLTDSSDQLNRANFGGLPNPVPTLQNAILPALNQPTRAKRNTYSTEEWNRHIPKIKELYLQDGLKLEEVMTRMTQDHGFSPSLVEHHHCCCSS